MSKIQSIRIKWPLMLALVLLVLVGQNCRQAPSAEGPVSVFAEADNNLILELNNLTYTIANEHDQFYSFIGVRALAMVHLAIHDIFNAIEPKYEVYRFKIEVDQINPWVAAASSTKEILNKAYPDRRDTINLICNKWIASEKDEAIRQKSLRLGQDAATFYIKIRANDGHEKQGDYTPMTKPGDYQYTPEFDWVWKPDFSAARPFTLDSIPQFRSPAPPSIDSDTYLSSYQEVLTYGSKTSTVRTANQTHYAHWWAEFAEHSWNRIGRLTAAEKGLGIVETNRMFALLNMNLYDLYLVSFDSKYHYDTWRPYTAIRNADQDSNPNTEADPNWEPEMLTPPWPEYPSAHAAAGAAGAEIVTAIYGSPKVSFKMASGTALPDVPAEREYDDLDQAANDCADSRIMNGFHFRFATEEGKKQGRAVAKHSLSFLQPLEEG